MGVRPTGSAVSRYLELHEAAGGGGDIGRMQVGVDSAGAIEWYHETATDPHDFLLIGFWGPPLPSVASWTELAP